MNCANHPEAPVAAYCQFCGKPLCTECVHKVNNIISCEPCLAARVHAATAGANVNYGPATSYTAGQPFPPGIQPQPWGSEPWVAFVLGLIPGVGAMYNGQLAKGLAHVVIFALLVDLSHYNPLLGLVVAAWVVYQVFDAYQTAIARRDGLPLPNPLGLNNIGQWFGARNHGLYPGANPWGANPGSPNPGSAVPGGVEPVPPNSPAAPPPVGEPAPMSGFASHYTAPYSAPPTPPIPPNLYQTPDFWHCGGGRGIPAGAVVLIILGVAFLLRNLGIFSDYWIERGWPILLIAFGVWMVLRHRGVPPSGGVQ